MTHELVDRHRGLFKKQNILPFWISFCVSLLLAACARPADSPPSLATLSPSPLPPSATRQPTSIIIATATRPIQPASVESPLAPTQTAPQLESGVEGRVELGSTCGNQPAIGEAGTCAHRPLQTHLVVTNLAGQVVAEGVTAADGTFRFMLPAGDYRLVPDALDFVTAAPAEFRVEPGQIVFIPVLYETLIQ